MTWIEEVKKVQKRDGISYKEALKKASAERKGKSKTSSKKGSKSNPQGRYGLHNQKRQQGFPRKRTRQKKGEKTIYEKKISYIYIINEFTFKKL